MHEKENFTILHDLQAFVQLDLEAKREHLIRLSPKSPTFALKSRIFAREAGPVMVGAEQKTYRG